MAARNGPTSRTSGVKQRAEARSTKRPRTEAGAPPATKSVPYTSGTRFAPSTQRVSLLSQSAKSATNPSTSKAARPSVPLLLVTIPTDSPPASKRTHSMLDAPTPSANSSPSKSRTGSPLRSVQHGADRLPNAMGSSQSAEEESSQPKKKKRMMSKEMGKKVVRSPRVDEGVLKKSMDIVVDPVVTVFHANINAPATNIPTLDSPILAFSPRKAALSDKSNLGRPPPAAQLVFRPPPVIAIPSNTAPIPHSQSSSAAPSPSKRSPTKLRAARPETPKMAVFKDLVSPIKMFANPLQRTAASPQSQVVPTPLDSSPHFDRPVTPESVHSDSVDAPQLFNNDYSTAQFDEITPPAFPPVDYGDTSTPEVEPAQPDEGEIILSREGLGMDSSLVLETHSSVVGDEENDGDDAVMTQRDMEMGMLDEFDRAQRESAEVDEVTVGGRVDAAVRDHVAHHSPADASLSPSPPQESLRRIAPALKIAHLPLVDYDSSSSDVSVHEVIPDALGEEHDFAIDNRDQNEDENGMDLDLFPSDESQPAAISKIRTRNPLIDSDTSEDELSHAIHSKMSFGRTSSDSDDSSGLSEGEIGRGMKAGLRVGGKARGNGGRYNQILEEAILAEGDSWDPLMIDLEGFED